MADTETNETPEETPVAEATETVEETTTDTAEETPAAWTSPSQEEWQRMQQAIQFMAQQFVADDEPEPDYNDNPAAQILTQMHQRLTFAEQEAIRAQEARGKEVMKESFSKLEKKVGSFDYEVAETFADRLFQTGQERDPDKALEAGARMAAEKRKLEREEAIKEYQASLQGGDTEVGGESVGELSAGKAKTYDEVVARWAAQSEV